MVRALRATLRKGGLSNCTSKASSPDSRGPLDLGSRSLCRRSMPGRLGQQGPSCFWLLGSESFGKHRDERLGRLDLEGTVEGFRLEDARAQLLGQLS